MTELVWFTVGFVTVLVIITAADTIVRMIHAKAFRNQDNYTAVILEF